MMDVKRAAELTLAQMLVPPFGLRGSWPASGPMSDEHVRVLLSKICDGIVRGEKAHRWLGWAQCALVAAGAGTLDDMKEINRRSKFESELCRDLSDALNRRSAENGSHTPDFILAEYLVDCLAAFDKAVRERGRWYGRLDSPGQSDDGAAPRPPAKE